MPHDSGTSLLTTGMHVVGPFSKEKEVPTQASVKEDPDSFLGTISLLLSTNGRSWPIGISFFCKSSLCKFTLVFPLKYMTATTAITLPGFAFSITFRSSLMVSAAVLVTLIGRGSVDVKLRPKGSSNLRCLSTRTPVSLHPISYSLLLCSFLKPLSHE